ncbi:MAG TPA: BatD family protein [Thermoanaerobaculia bacterium]|nr:BatD family protein [Thermoanaerobaculia bacterium]
MRAVLLGMLLFAALPAIANRLEVTPRRIAVGDSVTISITLEDSFAALDAVPVPLQNLELTGGPFISRQYEWVNGRFTRRKMLQYRARPLETGSARVGPVRLRDDRGKVVQLAAVTLEVVDTAAGGRARLGESAPLRLTAVVDRTEAVIGQQVLITWYLIGEDVEQIRLMQAPLLDGFWTEELSIDHLPVEAVRTDAGFVRKFPVKRMALYPLRTGTLEIGEVEVSAQVLRPLSDARTGIWSLFERQMVDVPVRSRPVPLSVEKAEGVAAGTPVGHFALHCSDPVVPAQGPVTMELTVQGSGNLRGASPPALERSDSAMMEIEELGVSVRQTSADVQMTRRWRLLFFPAREGSVTLPPVSFAYYDPKEERERILSCGGGEVERSGPGAALAVGAPPAPREDEVLPRNRRHLIVPMTALMILVAAGSALLIAWKKRRGPELQSLLDVLADPPAMRETLYRLAEAKGHHPSDLLRESGERGEAYRALVSLIDLMEKEPWEIERSRGELERRARDLLRRI